MKNKETLEEAAYQDCKKSGFNNTSYTGHCIQSFINGAKWQAENYGLMEIELRHTKTLLASCEKALEERDKQQERMYSEEEVQIILSKLLFDLKHKGISNSVEWFEQFKKK